MGSAKADIVSERVYDNSIDPFSFKENINGIWALLKLGSTQSMDAQIVEFHLMSGVLLVDGKTVQRELPMEHRNSEAIHQVFPFQRLSVNPSSLRGIAYKLGMLVKGHEVHIGFRHGQLVIRAFAAGELLEFIPTSVYQNNYSFDLPASLVENCVHWLNVRKIVIEIRKATMIWRSLDSNWRINLSSRTGYRSRGIHNLIDSRGNLFNHVASNFRGVERKGLHVEVHIKSPEALYARYFLDEVLGRATCATEPRLYYTKALLHALTSFCLPDSLTGETGTEEACNILQSGDCQPYTPLTAINMTLLDHIAGLTPLRMFYPPELRVMETVTWDPQLTVGMQDDRFKHLVDLTKARSDIKLQFELNQMCGAPTPSPYLGKHPKSQNVNHVSDGYLVHRSQNRRQMFQKRLFKDSLDIGPCDMAYPVRGYTEYDAEQSHVLHAPRLLQQWSKRLPSPGALVLMMQNWPHIGGFGNGTVVYDKLRLSDQLNISLASSWGSR
ncbi:uncharacterized protein A1O9_07709 [Exophiala aquamarina CBS 119918]|uniref:Uncharacterized protein n=1 Tax=Exophiala aquamarina CBS 119918 TaxID=1182545 RepID=A0A072PA30_9EURO|nr:uncharacterized protein A1O9_07709 [Exophiala aquamarina CBS 119918]KEF56128.1 hypothetical protein A1O9_07709 [Exophiala aquamarina CBS 119918]